MAKYMNPIIDFGFKYLFGTERNKIFLIDLINQLLNRKLDPIEDVTFLNTHFLGGKKTDRVSVFDVYCETNKGEFLIVEMQTYWQIHYKQRSIYYSTFPIQKQAKKGNWDFFLAPVYCITFIYLQNEPISPSDNELIVEAKLCSTSTKQVYYNDLTYITVQIHKFDKLEHDCKSELDKWLFLLKYTHDLNQIPLSFKTPIFMKFLNEAELVQLDDVSRIRYESRLKAYRDRTNGFKSARLAGKMEGIEIGIEQGKSKTIQSIILNGLKEGMSVEVLSKLTGVSVEEIEQIRLES